MKNKALRIYLIGAFVLAWILQALAIPCARNGQAHAFQLLLLVSMYAPFAAVLLARVPLGGMGWRPRLRGRLRYYLAAWLGPALLGFLGAALYFLVFPSHLDMSGAIFTAQLGEEGLAQLEAQGMSLRSVILIQLVQALTWAPLINTFAALGEEVGWRGALYPMLKERFGVSSGRVIGGVIWGVWHWPVMILAGYNYGMQYWGAPVLGPLLFCLVTVALGTLFDLLYEKSGSIWIPSLAHGAFNAAAGIPSLFLSPAYPSNSTLGPTMIGLIGGLPLFLLAAWALRREHPAKA